MPLKIRCEIAELKAMVDMTGASGQWSEKGAGHWQFRADDGAVLNWWQSSGTLNFQGPLEARQEFEQIFELAMKKAASEPAPASAPAIAEAAKPELPPLKPIQTGRYRHYKGNEYEVLAVVRHSETLEELVLYRPLYGERALWVRPRGMFEEMVTVDGQRRPRFAYVGPA